MLVLVFKSSCEFTNVMQPVERVGRCGINSGMPENLLVVSCEEDLAVCMPLLEAGKSEISLNYHLICQ